MTRDVIVVGAGAIGVSCALELARRGASVTVLEAGAAVGAGCSAGNAGLLCPSHAQPLATRAALLQGLRWSLRPNAPFAIRPRASLIPWLARFAAACTPAQERRGTDLLRQLSRTSLDLFETLRQEIGLALERTGTLNVYETEPLFETACEEARAHGAAGMRFELLTAGSAYRSEPALQGPVAGAIFYPDDLSGDPLEFVRTTSRAAVHAGTSIRTGAEVLALLAKSGRVTAVETTVGRLTAGEVVLAAGAWSPRLLRALSLRLPLEAGKGYHVDFDSMPADPHVPIFLHESRVVVTPLPGRLRLAGTLELAGLDLGVDRRRVDAIVRAGVRSVRGLVARPPREIWRGLRPCAPDGLPVIGRAEPYENLVVATGHAALGFTLAPLTGRLVAQLVAGETPDHDLAPLSPGRFHSFRRSDRHA